MTIFAAAASKDMAIIVVVSIITAIILNIGPLVALVIQWVGS